MVNSSGHDRGCGGCDCGGDHAVYRNCDAGGGSGRDDNRDGCCGDCDPCGCDGCGVSGGFFKEVLVMNALAVVNGDGCAACGGW